MNNAVFFKNNFLRIGDSTVRRVQSRFALKGVSFLQSPDEIKYGKSSHERSGHGLAPAQFSACRISHSRWLMSFYNRPYSTAKTTVCCTGRPDCSPFAGKKRKDRKSSQTFCPYTATHSPASSGVLIFAPSDHSR